MKDVEGDCGPYRISRTLGSGGMGVVYEAWDTRLDRRVAIKMVHGHLLAVPGVLAAFNREARHAARVEHPNVVRVYRVDVVEGQVVIEMQYVDGVPFSRLLDAGPISPTHAANLLRQLLEALAACHEQGIIHCDLKPGNLLVTRHDRVMLTDFGVARAFYEAGAAQTTPEAPASLRWGTPQYSPPEAWSNNAITPQWDLYTAGALMYEALTGNPPFHGLSRADLANAVRTRTPRSISAIRPDVSEAFAELVMQLMARDPAVRPASAGAALVQLNRSPESQSSGPDTEPLEEMRGATTSREEGSRKTRPMYFALAAVFVLAGLGAVSHFLYHHAKPAPMEAGTVTPASSLRGTSADELLVEGNCALFAADDGVHGRELWQVAAGQKPELVADIVPGPRSSNPRRFMLRPQGGFVFAATTPETGEELWFASSPGGGRYSVSLIKDIIPGPMGSNPEPVAAAGALVLFYATTLREGRELWCTNVHEGQTAIVADVLPGVGSSVPMNPRAYADKTGAYIVALSDAVRGCVLYRYDYATNALREIGDVADDTAGLARAGHRILFPNTDEDHGWELWAYDEDTENLGLLADLSPGKASSNPSELKTWGERVMFQARTPESGAELWISDGTTAGTHMVADINPGSGDSDPYDFTVVDKYVFFRAKDDACGRELWVTDGTGNGTSRVADIMPGAASGEPYNLTPTGSSLVLTANDGVHGEELWGAFEREGAWSGALLFDLEPGRQSSEPHRLHWCDNGCGFLLATMPEAGEVVYLLRKPVVNPVSAEGWTIEQIAATARIGKEARK